MLLLFLRAPFTVSFITEPDQKHWDWDRITDAQILPEYMNTALDEHWIPVAVLVHH